MRWESRKKRRERQRLAEHERWVPFFAWWPIRVEHSHKGERVYEDGTWIWLEACARYNVAHKSCYYGPVINVIKDPIKEYYAGHMAAAQAAQQQVYPNMAGTAVLPAAAAQGMQVGVAGQAYPNQMQNHLNQQGLYNTIHGLQNAGLLGGGPTP